MSIEQDFLKEKGIIPSISFKKSPKHTVKIQDRKRLTINCDGEKVDGISYLVEENGENKKFFTGSPNLIAQLAEFEKDDIVTIEMKKRKTPEGFRTFYEVKSETEKSPPEDYPDADPNEVPEDIPF